MRKCQNRDDGGGGEKLLGSGCSVSDLLGLLRCSSQLTLFLPSLPWIATRLVAVGVVLACVLYKIETMKGHTEIQALGGVERCIRAVGRIRTRQERD
jgi:hypothetical protein